MSKLEIQYRVLGNIGTNVYFLIHRDTKETIIVDPADNAAYLASQCEMRGYQVKGIILTHGHFDHIYGANELRDLLQVPIYAYVEEAALLADPEMNRSRVWAEPMGLKADVLLKDGEVLELAGFRLKVIHTPGHTQGSCCYYLEEEGVLIAGDTLFRESYGRTDLETGSWTAMFSSLKILLDLPEETMVCPGHGEETSIGHEKKYNPAAY